MSSARTSGAGRRRLRTLLPALGLVPFLVYVFLFLVEPTIEVVVGAFQDKQGTWTTDNLTAIRDPLVVEALRNSLVLSVSSAILGAVLGAVLAALVVDLPETSLVRRWTVALSGVFAQFGGVTLAFAFIATFSAEGLVTRWILDLTGKDTYNGWLFTLGGLVVVYLYFQIPLMVIVFLPALEGMRSEWREAAMSLGASRWQYLTNVAVPVLRPAFLGAFLLLFANAFAAFATAAALISNGNLILPMVIRSRINSEVAVGAQHVAYAVALEMILIVAIVMAAYGWLLRRTTRWVA